MAVIKIKKRDNPYVMFDKTFLRDNRLSAKSKGILAYLLSLPADWSLHVNELAQHFSDGKKSIYGALKELKEFGYVQHHRHRDINGSFTAGDYVVYELPQLPLQDDDVVAVGDTEPTASDRSDVEQVEAKHEQIAHQSPRAGKGDVANCSKSNPHSPLRHVANRHDVKGHVLKNNNNKIITAAKAVACQFDHENTMRTTGPPSSAAAVSFSCAVAQDPPVDADLVIGDELTPSQRQVVEDKAKQLSLLVDHTQRERLVEDIVWLLLSSHSFSHAGKDFHHKLNTIAKCIRQRQWQPPAKRLVEQATVQRQAVKQRQRDYQALLNEQTHLAFLLGHAPTADAKEKLKGQLTAISERFNTVGLVDHNSHSQAHGTVT